MTRLPYPATRREALVETIHGVPVADPYRWLEDGDSPEVQAWTAAQNALTRRVLDAVPAREAIRARVAELMSVGVVFAPTVRNGRAFHIRREAGQEQAVLYWRTVDGPDRPLVDPAAESGTGTVAIDWWYPSPDGALVAYGLSRDGDEQSTLRVRVVEGGRDLGEEIPRTRFCSLAWLSDSSGFYYTRFPLPGSVPPGEEEYGRRVFFHRLGDDWRRDAEIFGAGRPRENTIWLGLSRDGRWLCVADWYSAGRNDLFVLDRRAPERGFVAIADGIDARFVPDAQPDALWILTNLDAPRSRVVRVDYARPAREHWQEVIPEGLDPIRGFAVAGGRVACTLLRGATSAMQTHRADGTLLREVTVPSLSSIDDWTAEGDQDDLHFACQSFVTPPAVYRHRVSTGEQAEWARITAPVRAAAYETQQVWLTSRDGTRLPMFLIHRAGLARDGARPTVLYGYGGFDISMVPVFLRGAHVLLEAGGVFAMANLRGGGEFGEAWHRAGMLDRKQNVFDDGIAAAEWLIAEGYTRPERLAVQGASNGGLLVGAMITQRPDLFRAAVCQVPLIDMLRYHRFDYARAWATEYGASDDPAQFPFLHAYSPYHRVEAGRRYPALLVTAGEKDSRCDPLHARKLAAAMQAATASERPALLRVQAAAGHGQGKPVSTLIEEVTDIWCFLARELGFEGRAAISP